MLNFKGSVLLGLGKIDFKEDSFQDKGNEKVQEEMGWKNRQYVCIRESGLKSTKDFNQMELLIGVVIIFFFFLMSRNLGAKIQFFFFFKDHCKE